MAFGEDWFGWTIFLFIICSIIFITIKIIIEYPGLLKLKCVYLKNEDEETIIEHLSRKEKKEDFNEEEELTGATEKAGERRTVCFVEEASENISMKEDFVIVINQDNADSNVELITVNEENTPDGKLSAGYSENPP